ncbi:MAG TPA: MazG nucleotide pyrophosphohydrolase domain-containing protein [Armatimonadota bacterium]|jgi:NTP pyrophosphatase (non-canonical NTP hydrolase)
MGPEITLAEFQRQIERIYFDKDAGRGLEASFMWLVEEVGELSRALRREEAADRVEEFSDVLAWLCTLASIAGVELADAVAKYAQGCPKCHGTPCACGEPMPGGGA